MIRLKAKANDWDDQQMFWPFHRSSALQSGWLPRLQRFRYPASALPSTHPSTHLKIDFRHFNYYWGLLNIAHVLHTSKVLNIKTFSWITDFW
jgi:hypothetical protein